MTEHLTSARRCARCSRQAAIVVEPGERDDGTVAVCTEHLEWAFLAGLEEWSGRRPAA